MSPLKPFFAIAAIALTAPLLLEAQTIRDDQAAVEWTDAYPVGNGRLGAMPFSQFPTEKILLNEETIWHRGPDLRMPKDSFKHLETIRELEAAGKYAEADRVFETKLQKPADPYSYQYLGWLQLDYLTDASLESTNRQLELQTGIASTTHTLSDGNQVTQRVYASAPLDLLVVEITATSPIGLRLSIEDGRVEDGDLVLDGISDGEHPDRTRYQGRFRFAESANAENDTLLAPARRSHTLLLSAATNFDLHRSGTMLSDGWQSANIQKLDTAENSLATLRQTAIADHRTYFDRVTIDLGETAPEIASLTTPERLKRIQDGNTDDPDLIETYFQFGRYLLIASSRPGTFPANLQGIWNPHEWAPWSSDFHLNINIQMNYWHAETTNLSELHQPFFDLIRYYQPKGREMAKRLGMKGWGMGHASDIWANAHMMSSRSYWGGSFFGGQWMTLHILEQFRFTQDTDFLAEHWDLLTASVEFVDSWLIPGPEDGQLMARPACSPENSFLYTDENGEAQSAAFSAGNSFDQYMVLQVFSDYLEAAEALGKQDDAFAQEIASKLPKVYRPRIANDGRLMEWRLPFEEKEPAHRHISHVLGAYPGNQINLDTDPEMRSAVEKVIEERIAKGGAATGWSRAWTIGMYARLSEAETAYHHLIEILRQSTVGNLFDMHPPFQIDGNFGATAAIAEMLLHSHNDEIRLLPALPEAWATGSVSGLRARGDFTITMNWKDGELASAEIVFGDNSPPSIVVRYAGQTIELRGQPGSIQTIDSANF
ncbi:glycoside hydrolase family 95 protein [Pelagicoccus sp. SDUM812003]|uniref:glycoside hydrolase family 95 protein n=1 Tax=Pelagicoccus sp. SDUM812003 TaxID=3041267 RepID=UPI00280E3DA7|nr:glycoside hydrolase family 95 protein [Pelagicoccus sp. SDUM812003]MDQ8201781.1 glycoside hydrolase family 95 protein [Pelagicoccus sp. SDUM812003]